jgi:hypothetical protein
MAKRVLRRRRSHEQSSSLPLFRALDLAGLGLVVACVLVSLGLVVLEAVQRR